MYSHTKHHMFSAYVPREYEMFKFCVSAVSVHSGYFETWYGVAEHDGQEYRDDDPIRNSQLKAQFPLVIFFSVLSPLNSSKNPNLCLAFPFISLSTFSSSPSLLLSAFLLTRAHRYSVRPRSLMRHIHCCSVLYNCLPCSLTRLSGLTLKEAQIFCMSNVWIIGTLWFILFNYFPVYVCIYY